MTAWEERVIRRHHSPKDYLDAARDEDADAELLAGLATVSYGFVKQAVAERAETPPGALLAMVPVDLHGWNERRLLRTLIEHPSATDDLLRKATDLARGALAVGDRPYAVTIALARRGWLDESDIKGLAGSSARLCQGVRRAAQRTTSEQ